MVAVDNEVSTWFQNTPPYQDVDRWKLLKVDHALGTRNNRALLDGSKKTGSIRQVAPFISIKTEA